MPHWDKAIEKDSVPHIWGMEYIYDVSYYVCSLFTPWTENNIIHKGGCLSRLPPPECRVVQFAGGHWPPHKDIGSIFSSGLLNKRNWFWIFFHFFLLPYVSRLAPLWSYICIITIPSGAELDYVSSVYPFFTHPQSPLYTDTNFPQFGEKFCTRDVRLAYPSRLPI
jgi:hypothetical protein